MAFRQWRQFRWKYLVLLPITAVGIAVFQNCNATNSSFGNSGGVSALLVSQPIPVLFNLNEISYMSCPMAGSASTNGGLLASPYYRVRVGSFDNSAANGFFNPTGGTAPADQVGGIGFSAAAMTYERKTSANPSPAMLANYLSSSPYTSNAQPVVVMINQTRDTNTYDPVGLAQTALAQQVLLPLSDPTFSYLLSNATQIPGAGTRPAGYFPTLANGTNALTATLTWGSSDTDENQFRNWLNSLEYIFAGFAPSTYGDAVSITQHLANPNTVTTGTTTTASTTTGSGNLFGYGYQLSFPPNDPGLYSVTEYDLNPSGTTQPTNLTALNNQGWDCFSLTVVRDLDRKYWSAATPISGVGSPFLTALLGTSITITFQQGNIIHPMDVNAIGRSNPSLQTNYINDGLISTPPSTNDIPYLMYNLEAGYTNAASGHSPSYVTGPNYAGNINTISTINLSMGQNGYDGGTYYACPPEDPSGQTGAVSALTPGQRALNNERRRIVRRFLPASFWEVNMADSCVVPTTAAENLGSCYGSAGVPIDNDQSKYIQYNGIQGTSCGPGMTECPAKVSFCWRYH